MAMISFWIPLGTEFKNCIVWLKYSNYRTVTGVRFGCMQSFCIGSSDGGCPAGCKFLWCHARSQTVQLISLSFGSWSPVSSSHGKRAVEDEFVLWGGSSSLFLPQNEGSVRALYARWPGVALGRLTGDPYLHPWLVGPGRCWSPTAPGSPAPLEQPCSCCSLAGSRVPKFPSLLLRQLPQTASACAWSSQPSLLSS